MSTDDRGRRARTPERAKTPDARARPPVPAPITTVSVARAAGNKAVTALLTGGIPVIQRDVVSDVEDKMSYGALDWAITDSEATAALNELAALTGPALADAMNRLSQTAKTRLLDNIPAAARATTAYTKVIVAMGPDAVMPYLTSLLSYGIFDWAITDSEAETVFRVCMALPEAQQLELVNKFDTKLRHRFADNLQREATAGEKEQSLIRFLFDKTPDDEVDTLKLWMTIRFRVKFGTESSSGEGGLEWDGPSLRRMYNVLQALPPGAVEANPSLTDIDRYKDTKGAGGYYQEGLTSGGQVALGTKNLTDVDRPGVTAGFTEVADPLVGQNIFDDVVRHEVGHSVDNKLGLSKANSSAVSWGAWQEHGKGGGLAEIMVAASAGAIAGLSAARKAKVIGVLQDIIDDRDPDKIDVKLMLLGFDGATWTAVQHDPAVDALRVCFADLPNQNPWYIATGGGVHVGGRIYQEAYANTWVSYDPAARAQKVSLYQFRSPAEWFAEAYNAYYAPPTKGSVLAASNASLKAWFDVNVDQATGGAGATAPGPALPPPATGPGFP